MTSGPGTVTFADANAEDTTATFSTYGTYVLKLTATDTDDTVTDTMTVEYEARIGLLVHYKFDESSGTVADDSSGNNWDGVVDAGPTWSTGYIDGALDLGANGQVLI